MQRDIPRYGGTFACQKMRKKKIEPIFTAFNACNLRVLKSL